ncbi:MAG: hypothetical protein MMC33_002146 [Icmadophila ericetorum]|nr:hypothetical protein [Icmadophila ericetorum]
MDKAARVVRTKDVVMQMTSWSVLYYRLRANFDGLRSDMCMVPTHETGVGNAIYDYGKTVTDISYDDGLVTVQYGSVDGTSSSLQADLVIAADGPGSFIRQKLLPKVKRQYAGYIAWRGFANENDISEETKQALGESLTYHLTGKGHILVYWIPSDKTGSVKLGERLLNFVWYDNYPESSPELVDIMTDNEGYRHRTTLPMGKMRDEVWTRRKASAAAFMPAPFMELIDKTPKPFTQMVADVYSPRASFYGGKVLIVGDAFTAFRPHASQSTNQAARSALLLGKVMEGKISMEEWERSTAEFARVVGLLSIKIGCEYQGRTWDWVVSSIQYNWALVMQWVRKRWYG